MVLDDLSNIMILMQVLMVDFFMADQLTSQVSYQRYQITFCTLSSIRKAALEQQ